MTNNIGGIGITLPPPQIPYPANLTSGGVSYQPGNAVLSLAPGQSIVIPAGRFMVDLGKYSILEWQDPVAYPNPTLAVGAWKPIRTQRGTFQINSDGVNYRISNLTGCVVSGVVTNVGGGVTPYVQASTTVTPSTGDSTWYPVVGGALSTLSCSVVGAGYGRAPQVYIPGPPGPGRQASAVATISGGAINGFTLLEAGAGYTSNPTVTILPDPFDVNVPTTAAVASFTGTLSTGTLEAVVLTNTGAPVASTMTLSVGGVGTSAAVTPQFLQTIASLSIATAGSGTATGAIMITSGGLPTTSGPTVTDNFIPRQAVVTLTVTSGSGVTAGTLVDSGLFLSKPNAYIVPSGGTFGVTTPVIIPNMGSANDTVLLQPC